LAAAAAMLPWINSVMRSANTTSQQGLAQID
jgi:hypothetical protein